MDSALIEKLLVPALVGLAAWLVKNVVVAMYKSRQEQIRAELTFRLREVYSPLFLWSGVIAFKGTPGKDKFGVAELVATLAKSANLLPVRHYFIFVRLLEHAMGQSTTLPALKDIKAARDYVYSRIEAINFVLYRQPGIDDLAQQVDTLATLRAAVKVSVGLALQLVLWGLFVAFIFLLYLAISGRPIVLALVILALLLVLLAEGLRRHRLYKRFAGLMSGH